MISAPYDFIVYNNEDLVRNIQLTDGDGTAINLTGSQVKAQVTDGTTNFIIGCTVTNAVLGKLTLTFDKTQSVDIGVGTWRYDLVVMDSLGTETNWFHGDFQIRSGVTQWV
jgi:hypothetical protein